MKIIKIETVRLTSRPTLIWLRVHTDEGLSGLARAGSAVPRLRPMSTSGSRPPSSVQTPAESRRSPGPHGLMSASAAPGQRSAPSRPSTSPYGTSPDRLPASRSTNCSAAQCEPISGSTTRALDRITCLSRPM